MPEVGMAVELGQNLPEVLRQSQATHLRQHRRPKRRREDVVRQAKVDDERQTYKPFCQQMLLYGGLC